MTQDQTIENAAAELRKGIRDLARRAEVCRLALQTISKCTLKGVDFGDYVQTVCDTALLGEWPECWNCGTAVHDGPCVRRRDETGQKK